MRAIGVFILLFLTVVSVAQKSGYEVGSEVEAFRLRNVDGKQVGLADYAESKGVIVVFTCNTCPVAKAYEQRIAELDGKYRDKGFPVVAINPNDAKQSPGDSFEEMKNRAAKKGYSFPYLIDEDQSVTRAFGATRTPHLFVLQNESGKQTVRYIGAIDNNQGGNPDSRYVEEAVDALLKGSSPEVPFTKAVGCGIKFKKNT